MFKIKKFLKKTFLGPILISIVDFYRFLYWKSKRLNFTSTAFDPNEIFWIDPSEVTYRSNRMRNKKIDFGKIIDGDWDQWGIRFDDHDEIRWMYERFVEKKDWQETELYIQALSYFNTGKWVPPYQNNKDNFHIIISDTPKDEKKDYWVNFFKSKEELDARCKDFDDLFESIKKNGIIPQNELVNKYTRPEKAKDDIILDIARDGELLFCDGKHRFAMAKILGLKSIPVRICKRHKIWGELHQTIIEYLAKNGKLYQTIDHIDLVRYDSFHSDQRLPILDKNIDGNSGYMVDLGTNMGYFSSHFAKKGFECTVVEHDEFCLKILNGVFSNRFTIIDKNILDLRFEKKIDVLLALSILHHFTKTEELFISLKAFLNELKLKCMIFEPNNLDSKTMIGAYKIFSPEEFVNFIIENTNLNSFKLIGVEELTERKLYKITE